MIRLYLIGGLLLLCFGLSWALKQEIGSNATLKGVVEELEAAKAEAEDVAFFQQSLGVVKDIKLEELRAIVKRNGKDLRDWNERYHTMLNSKPENRAWGDVDVPADVIVSMRRNRRAAPDPARARDEARLLVERLRSAAGDVARQEQGPAASPQGVGDGAPGLQRPAATR